MSTPWRWSCEERGVYYWTSLFILLTYLVTWKWGGENLHFLLVNIVSSHSWLTVAETRRLGPTEPRLLPLSTLETLIFQGLSKSVTSSKARVYQRRSVLFSLFCSNRNTAKMMSTEPPKHIFLALAICSVFRELKIQNCRTLSCWSPLKSDITIPYLRQL